MKATQARFRTNTNLVAPVDFSLYATAFFYGLIGSIAEELVT